MSSQPQLSHRVVPPSRRRDKPVLSCSLCRRRKLKCDRQKPCKTCVERGVSLSCTYDRPTGPAQGPKAPHNVHDRIDQLEKLVTTLMDEKSRKFTGSSPAFRHRSDDNDGEVAGTPDRVKLEKDATSYTNSGHWTSILDGITELRDELDQIPTGPQSPKTAPDDISGPDLFFGRQRHATHSELLAAVPPRKEADELVISYFGTTDMAPLILHRPTFLREYDQFWEQPYKTPVMWLSLLMSIFAVATRFQAGQENPDKTPNRTPDSSLYSARIDFYREKVVQCLILANYAKCPPYTIEALLQYFITEYFRSQDTQFGIWMLVGLIVRIAFRMGYHREPSRFPNISLFKAEMRRRIWTQIVQLDLISSAQVGLPRMIQPQVSDVIEPRNLIDADLYENMTELPPSRTESETTVMLFTLARNRVLLVLARIMDLTNSTTQPAYSDVMEINSDLRAEFAKLPPTLRVLRAKDFECANTDNDLRGLFCRLNFLKVLLMLHRPFLLLGRTDSKYEYSRLACLDAALEILQYQKKLDEQSRPGETLWNAKWRTWSATFRYSSLVNHDFLLATTVVSLDLDRDFTSPISHLSERPIELFGFQVTPPTRADLVDALTSAYAIWVAQIKDSREAIKICAALRVVLRKANAQIDLDQFPDSTTTPSSQMDISSFADFSQPGEFSYPTGLDTNSGLFDINDPNMVTSFLANDPFMDLSGFDWGGPEFGMPLPMAGEEFHGFPLG